MCAWIISDTIIHYAGEDDYICRMNDKNLTNEQKLVTWQNNGIDISTQTPIPQGQEVFVRASTYGTTKSSFIFPHGYTFLGKVYMINISATDASLVHSVQVCFKQRNRRRNIRVLQASGIPTHWDANRSTPMFSFSEIAPQRVQSEHDKLVLCPGTPHCYLVIAGKIMLSATNNL